MSQPSSLLFALTLFGGTASALALRHDVGEQAYLDLGAKFPTVVQVGGLGTGTLVARDWVLSAAHVPEMLLPRLGDSALTVAVADETFEVARVVYPEGRETMQEKHDIALLQLKKPVSTELTPLGLWKAAVEPGAKFVLAGWGILSTGEEGIKVSPKAMAAKTRRLRAGWNEVDRRDDEKGLLFADFDAPDVGLELEAGPCLGDSGGPLLIRVEGAGDEPATWRIGGVIALIDDQDEDGVIGEYGDVFGVTPIHAYSDWIEATIRP